eukprot:CAMPEP_0201537872 /NCGR_PEP_ID=MMETSP0161_2-20130828/66024_1 /ASSEMBLY_ACC=CAM_ASM_000251 /TAXON_ID=180227 /ORGANISM="Neoparamoeba aestuarina, Strain SoJaBio B1-5/56/2" /LENGTH=101 /DNA_ID=CAMNT_0047944411 /DNA_START=198 /DNA_END=503 /DNA_ORIENTATION=-
MLMIVERMGCKEESIREFKGRRHKAFRGIPRDDSRTTSDTFWNPIHNELHHILRIYCSFRSADRHTDSCPSKKHHNKGDLEKESPSNTVNKRSKEVDGVRH